MQPLLRLVSSKLVFIILTLSPVGNAEEARIAVASNFSNPAKAIQQAFEQKTGRKVSLSFASSGKLYAQIKHGAPYDILLSADQEKPNKLIADKLALANSQFTYAIGRIVLWAPHIEIPASEKLLITDVSATDKQIFSAPNMVLEACNQDFAIANQRVSPYGLASEQIMQNLRSVGFDPKKRIYGENINQVYHFILSGNARAGFIALSQLRQTQQQTIQRHYWLVPKELHAPILQDAVLLARAKKKPTARAFLAFLKTNEAQKIIKSYGYNTEL